MKKIWSSLISDDPRKLWVRYCAGISLILSLLLTAHLIQVISIRQGAEDAALIDLSGRQRMLSQRIAGLSHHLLDPAERARFEPAIAESLRQFEKAHLTLIGASEEFSRAALVYDAGAASGLDQQTRIFSAFVTAALDMRPDDARLAGTVKSIQAVAFSSLLSDLDQAVKAFSAEAQARLERLHRLQNAALVLALALLAVEVLLIFLPGQMAVNKALRLKNIQTRRLERRYQDLQALTRQLDHAAHYDALTGVANRTKLLHYLATQLSRPHGEKDRLCVFHVDLDRFKEVNDTLGHPVGDAVLLRAANAMTSRTRDSDMVARVGGDEFVIAGVFSGSDAETQIEVLASEIIALISQPMQINGQGCRVGASIGYVVADHRGQSAEDLISNADIALYEAKRAGKGVAVRFSAEMRDMLVKRHCLIQELESAVLNKEFIPHFQPKVCLRSGRVKGFEVLCRWDHPKRGLLLPGDFLALAEETGFVEAIDRQTVFGGLDALRDMRDAGWIIPGIAINAAGASLRSSDYSEMLIASTKARGLEPSDVHIEVIESILISDDEDPSLAALKRLSELGFKIDIDDFGTGYASLSMLSKMQLNALKIDRGLVSNLHDPRVLQIIEAIVGLGKGMNLEIVVEGVETPGQFNQLLKLGCTTAQGYGIGHPVCFKETISWLEAYGARPSLSG